MHTDCNVIQLSDMYWLVNYFSWYLYMYMYSVVNILMLPTGGYEGI